MTRKFFHNPVETYELPVKEVQQGPQTSTGFCSRISGSHRCVETCRIGTYIPYTQYTRSSYIYLFHISRGGNIFSQNSLFCYQKIRKVPPPLAKTPLFINNT
jgi:hypothetical protein